MSNRKRKHGIFAVSSEAVEMIQTEEMQQQKLTGKPIEEALATVFNQMKVAGNRPRTIESYEYIFKQFVQINGIEFVEQINIDSIYNYLGALDVSQRTKLIRLKSIKAVLSKFHLSI
ncbi:MULTISPECIES: hypothetical protein [Lysinibacillus]|uniref:hypothetical protein n=1 Tax=Lysinibacillus TaxID=400634 RepID=UPI0018CD366B|nr:hypothetical protein [Lysinibacillus sphaericus]QTB12937.1 hypothetical protein J2B92_19395 [Lysinibacillus sphaericus]